VTLADDTSRAWKRADARHHDREAARYDDLIGREFAPYQETHTAAPWARLLAESGARAVLDVGGGTGRTALSIAARGLWVVVLDASPGMLAVTRAKTPPQDRGRVQLVVGDAERLPFGAGSFDGVVCQGVLHHLPAVGSALAEANRVLSACGWLCLAEPDQSASTLSRAVRVAERRLRPMAGRLASRSSPAAHNERPLRWRDLVTPLRRSGYQVSTAFLVHPPIVYRFLPAAVSRRLAGALNRGATRRQAGDMVIVQARKPGERLGGPC
jgi:SAM-dependent methyltransferase